MTSAPGLPHTRPGLVGRAAELRALRWALDELAAGRGTIVELGGDPGIGKTRLLTELAEEAARRGVPVLRGSATEFEQDLPFQLFVDALRDRYRREQPADQPADQETDPDTAQLLATLFSGRGAPGSGAERFRLYSAVRDLLIGWTQADGTHHGLVLLLDDLHWADPGTIELAEYLVRRPAEAPLLLVLAQRGRQSPARLAGTLARGAELGNVVRIELGPLSEAESAELAGPGLDDVAVRDIWAESGGNPLYLLAVAASRRAGTGASPAAGPSQAGLEAILRAELAPLTAEESVIAAAAAVFGEPADLAALACVAPLSDPGATVSTLIRRDVLRPAAAPGLLTFRHPVLRRVVYETADPAWRIAAHRRALAELTRRGAPAAEQARHVEAAPGGPLEDDLAILLAAADAAMGSAPAAAAHWLQVALDRLPDDEDHATQRLAILLQLTRAFGVSGQAAQSRDLLHEILRRVPARPPGPRVAAVTYCAMMERHLTRYPEARALLTAELASARPAATAEGIALGIEYGMVSLLAADFAAARPVLADAVSRATRRGRRSRAAAAYGLATTGLGEIYEGDVTAALAAVDAATAIADTLTDGELASQPECLSILGYAELFLERYPDADRHFARGVAISRHSGHYHVLPHLLLGQCQRAGWCGPLDQAILLSEEAEEIARHVDSQDLLGLALGMRSFALGWSGGPDSAKRAVELAEQAVALIPAASVWWSRTASVFHSLALMQSGDPARCAEVMLATGGGPGLPLIQSSLRPVCYDLLSGAAVMNGNNDAARDWSQRADAEARKLPLPGQRGFALRSRGYVLFAAGRFGEAAGVFRAAGDLLGSAGVLVGQASALSFGAACADAAGQTGAALAMADEASALATTVGSLTILDAAQATRQNLAPGGGDRAGPRAGPLAMLTGREREIARLAATGSTSRAIAEQLSLSPRTVDTHLSRIYRKLALPSRAALARLLAVSTEKTID